MRRSRGPDTPADRLRRLGTVSRVRHRGQRAGWLRAAVLGANDGIVSVASVAIGVIASGAPTSFVLTAAIAALVAGAMAMAAGEYVSVSSQRDVERADLDQERGELIEHPEGEKQELAAIYVKRGLSTELAGKVAEALTASDALGAHARDELGMAAILARPVQAALYSALSFTAGAVLPIGAFLLVPTAARTSAVVVSALLALVALGIAGARAGGAPILRGAVRVCVGGGLAMAVTAGVGHLVGGIVA
jgi:VIT1/CCC1 family predicted Fe2+/Mn2+ transporter